MGDPETSERMNELEAMMWRLEDDPHLSSTFANLTFFDREPDPEALRRRMWRATRVVGRLRRRIVDGGGPLATPTWEDDPDFDLDHHLRRVELPEGATDSDARAYAVEMVSTPFDRSRPLWEFVVLTGLPDGRAAMVQKLHHTITDGKGGIRMSLEFVDLDRDAPEPQQIDDGPPEPKGSNRGRTRTRAPKTDAGVAPEGGQDWRSGWTELADAITDALADGARSGADAARAVVERAGDVVRDPAALAAELASLPASTAATVRSLVRQLAVVDDHRSPLWTDRSLERQLHTFDVSLERAKKAAGALGGSVNDLFVAAAAGGAGSYHRRYGHDVAELRMSMPVSTRTDRSVGGNAFTPTRVLVPLEQDARRRFETIHERLTVTKTEPALALVGSLAGLANLLPRPVVIRAARSQVMTVDFATSNVRAAPFDLYIAGALMTGNYPVGPVAGTAWNLTTMSYRGTLNIGLHADSIAVANPGELAEDIEAAFTELIEMGDPRKRRRLRR